MDSIRLGDVEITRVVEWSGPVAAAAVILPDSTRQMWQDNRSWLAPDFWRPDDDSWPAHVQTWIVRSEGRTILIDTGVGNDRQRPQVPQFERLHTDFLGRLAAAGVQAGEVDIVVNTHIHYDHVGWNTQLRDGQWVPTFPHARYLIPRPDNQYYDPATARRSRPPRDEQERVRWQASGLVFDDSVAPVHRAGQAVLWDDSYRIDGNLTVEAAPGHTPGSSVVRLRSGSDRAVFVGDILHTPLQIAEPDCNSCFCDDQVQAAATRRRVLGRAADLGELVVPAHFAGPGAAEVRRDGDRFRVAGWPTWS